MSIKKDKDEIFSNPRFEFRSFGQDFSNAFKRMARLSMPVPEDQWERCSDEIYILSAATDIHNMKVRDGKIDIKVCINSFDGLEQWEPLIKNEFPLTFSILRHEVFPVLKVNLPQISSYNCTYDQFIEMVINHPQLQFVNVHKKRYKYLVNNTVCETGIVLVNGAKVFTISTESTEVEDIRKTIKDIGLEGTENINYLQMLKRVTGMINKPLAN